MKKLAISLGDPNGIGIEIALKAHSQLITFCEPIYFINRSLLKQATKLLNTTIPENFNTIDCYKEFNIHPAKISKKAGKFSFLSFANAAIAVKNKKADALVTLPINKQAWAKANIKYHGHTDALSAMFKTNSIMMLGCQELFVALFTDHKPLKDVAKSIKKKQLAKFLCDFAKSSGFFNVGVLGLNPHAGDGGVIGDEDIKIKKAIKLANRALGSEIFSGPLVPDVAFNRNSLKKCNRLVAMYHDQGLMALKALYFEKAINMTLNIPIIRTSPDHGTAFDIAYQGKASAKSYIEAAKYATMISNGALTENF